MKTQQNTPGIHTRLLHGAVRREQLGAALPPNYQVSVGLEDLIEDYMQAARA